MVFSDPCWWCFGVNLNDRSWHHNICPLQVILEQRKSNGKGSHGFGAVIHRAARVLMMLGI